MINTQIEDNNKILNNIHKDQTLKKIFSLWIFYMQTENSEEASRGVLSVYINMYTVTL